MSCDVSAATEGVGGGGSAHSPTLPSLHLGHNSFSNPSVALPTSQLILQPFRCFSYVIAHYPTLPSLHLRHSSFSNPSVASPTSHALHLRHLASCPWASPRPLEPISEYAIVCHLQNTSTCGTGSKIFNFPSLIVESICEIISNRVRTVCAIQVLWILN